MAKPCPTVCQLHLMAACQKADKPCRWRTNEKRAWLSMGDPVPALIDAAQKFPGAMFPHHEEK